MDTHDWSDIFALSSSHTHWNIPFLQTDNCHCFFKVIVDVIQFTLPLTTFLLVSTVHIWTFDFSFNMIIWISVKITFFTTNWTPSGSVYFPPLVQTRLTDGLLSTTLISDIRLSTGLMTNTTNAAIRWWLNLLPWNFSKS